MYPAFCTDTSGAGAECVCAPVLLHRAGRRSSRTLRSDRKQRHGDSQPDAEEAQACTHQGRVFMNSKDLYNAIGKVDDDILEKSEAAANVRSVKSRRLKLGAMAACLCLVLVGAVIWKQIQSSHAPVFDNFPAGQVEHFAQGIIVGKAGLILGDLAELAVEALNDIGRVYDFPDFRWIFGTT